MENRLLLCRNCPFYKNTTCRVSTFGVKEDDLCHFLTQGIGLDKEQTIKVLSYFQKWRRGYDGKQPSGFIVGLAIDEAIRILRENSK